jgi:hypothetical protein
VQLRQAEAISTLDQDHRCVRHINANLDHRRRDQDVGLAVTKASHHRVFLARREASMHQGQAQVRKLAAQALELRRRGARLDSLRLLDQREYDERLATRSNLRAKVFVRVTASLGADEDRSYWLSSRRQLVKQRQF